MNITSPRLAAVLVALCLQPATAALAQVNEVGINAHIPEEALLDAIEGLAVGWVRVDANWNQLEPASGTYRWEVLDPAVGSARGRGLEVFVTLAYTPEWVPRVPSTRGDHVGNDQPVGSAEWVSFVEAAVRHYRAMGVTHFGMWNEANLDGFFEGTADDYYDKILVPGAAAVRRACGDCLVLGPELAHVGDVDVFLARLLDRGLGDEVDILTHHNYHGFTETGASALTGDTFLNALEMRRFSFTRASLRELLDDAGYTGEVWIAETGYEAERIGDVPDEERQAVYYRRVLEEQLLRPWWTNTFFYEIMDCGIDQPTCDIDGYGITRPARPITEGRAFPDDFRRKPAYDLLRDFIAAHPEIGPGGTAPPPPPPTRRRITALVGGDALTVDGDLSEWSAEGWAFLDGADFEGDGAWGGADDLGVRVAARWADGLLVVAVDVRDDVHDSDLPDDRLWEGDSVQLAFDVAMDGGSGYDDVDDHELTVALAGEGVRVRREHGPAGATLPAAAAARAGDRTAYEIAFPASSLPPASLRAGVSLGFSFVVNDADGAGREGWLELTPGIARGKEPGAFGEILLFEGTAPPPPPPGTDGGTPAPDAGTPGSDAGVPAGTDGGPGGVAPAGDAGGCGCGAAGAGAAPRVPWLAPALLLLVGLWRRRR